MTKRQFLDNLQAKLGGISQKDIDERLSFYSEMIEDRIEEGFSEEEAVAQIGSVDEVLEQIVAETSFVKVVKEKLKPKRKLTGTEILLFGLGFPLWFPLLVGVFAIALSCYVSFWSVIVSLWASFVALASSAMAGIVGGIVFLCVGKALSGVAVIASALVCAGLSILAFYACKIVTKYTLMGTKKLLVGSKKKMIKKEEA